MPDGPGSILYTMIQYGISCNIINVANQLFFAYQGIAPKLGLYVFISMETMKTSNFIYALCKKK